MFCSNCGKKVSKLDNYCNNCGELIHGYSRIIKRWNSSSNKPEPIEKLKQKLIKQYRGKNLGSIIKGRELKNSNGSCFVIEEKENIDIIKLDINKAKEKIASDLKLIYGIGKITEFKLKKQGYKDIYSLREHPRFKKDAKKFTELLENLSTNEIVEWICRWFSKSHPLIFCSSAFCDINDYIILDIETLGLYNRPIILIGMARIEKKEINIKQYLIRDLEEEASTLKNFISNIGKTNAFITFNGAMFDVPFLQERLYYYGIPFNLKRLNYDILHFSRKVWKEKFENYKLSTLEKFILGVKRKTDIPSSHVPDFYMSYLENKNIGPLIPIIEHNKQDIISLANLFAKINKEWKIF